MPARRREPSVAWLSEEEQSAWRGLQRMEMQLTAVLNRRLSVASGLSLQDYAVLVVLSECEDGTMRAFALGRELGWEKSRLSHHLARMERRGLIARTTCPSDQRGLLVSITDHGREAIAAAAPGHVNEVRRLFIDLLTPDQLHAIAKATEIVLDGLASQCDALPDG